MSSKTPAEMRYLSVRRAEDGRVTLHAATPAGQARAIPLTDLQAVVLIRDLAGILAYSVEKAVRDAAE